MSSCQFSVDMMRLGVIGWGRQREIMFTRVLQDLRTHVITFPTERGAQMKQVASIVAVAACLISAVTGCDPPKSDGESQTSVSSDQQVTTAAPTQMVMSGSMNQLLSNGEVGIIVDGFDEDPIGMGTSPVRYFHVRFTVKNLATVPLQVDQTSVEFTTADAPQQKPFKSDIMIPHTVEPAGTYNEETSGHFYFGKAKPTCRFTFWRAGKVVAGPFTVSLADSLP